MYLSLFIFEIDGAAKNISIILISQMDFVRGLQKIKKGFPLSIFDNKSNHCFVVSASLSHKFV